MPIWRCPHCKEIHLKEEKCKTPEWSLKGHIFWQDTWLQMVELAMGAQNTFRSASEIVCIESLSVAL